MLTHQRTRARNLPAEERRETILDAALPLVRDHGRSVTTKQIAASAGVSEATVFHVFDDKDALLEALVQREFRSDRSGQELAGIDPALPLDELVAAVVRAVRRRLTDIFTLMTALGMHRNPSTSAPAERQRTAHTRDRHEALVAHVADLLRPHAAQLRQSPERTAEALRIVTFAASHPWIADGSPWEQDEICELLLNGVTVGPTGGTTC